MHDLLKAFSSTQIEIYPDPVISALYSVKLIEWGYCLNHNDHNHAFAMENIVNRHIIE